MCEVLIHTTKYLFMKADVVSGVGYETLQVFVGLRDKAEWNFTRFTHKHHSTTSRMYWIYTVSLDLYTKSSDAIWWLMMAQTGGPVFF